VRSDHFVIPYQYLTRIMEDGVISQRSEEIRKTFPQRKIIISVDRCDRFAGLTLKFRMFHRFLSQYRCYQGQVVLLQYIETPSKSKAVGTEAEDILRELSTWAEKINLEFGSDVPAVKLEIRDMDPAARLEVLKAGDLCLDTSINDGLNLSPFLFVAAHSEDHKVGQGSGPLKAHIGVLVVSEFSGCSSVLTGAFKVNPWHTIKVMEILDKALNTTNHAQKSEQFARDRCYVSTMSSVKWAMQNVSEIKFANAQKGFAATSGLAAVCGFHGSFTGFRSLNPSHLMEDYKKAKSRCFFFDAEGTLSEKVQFYARPNSAFTSCGEVSLNTHGMPPDASVLHSLETLTKDKRNTVVVLSGRDRTTVEQWYGGVPGLGLCAEHGFFWANPGPISGRAPSSELDSIGDPSLGDEPQSRWHCHKSVTIHDKDWKSIVTETMGLYVRRVQGSIIEAKGSAVKWYFSEVGASLVTNSLARELARFLNPDDPNGVMHGYPVTVDCGKGYVEVRRSDVDKGVEVSRVLKRLKDLGQSTDFVLCIGDDRSDEDMFEAVNKAWKEHQGEMPQEPLSPVASRVGGPLAPITEGESHSSSFFRRRESDESSTSARSSNLLGRADFVDRDVDDAPLRKYYTVTVGRKPSKAQYFSEDVAEVNGLLKKMASCVIMTSFSRYTSMPNMSQLAIQEDEERHRFHRRSSRRGFSTTT